MDSDIEFFLRPERYAQLPLFQDGLPEKPQIEDASQADRGEPGAALLARSSPRHVSGPGSPLRQREYRLRPLTPGMAESQWALEHREVEPQGQQRAVYPWKPWKIGANYHDAIGQAHEDSQFRSAQSLHDAHAHHVQYHVSTNSMRDRLMRAKLDRAQAQEHLDALDGHPGAASTWAMSPNHALGKERQRLQNKLRDHDNAISTYGDYLRRADESHPLKINYPDLDK